jgi:hypothetical protein
LLGVSLCPTSWCRRRYQGGSRHERARAALGNGANGLPSRPCERQFAPVSPSSSNTGPWLWGEVLVPGFLAGRRISGDLGHASMHQGLSARGERKVAEGGNPPANASLTTGAHSYGTIHTLWPVFSAGIWSLKIDGAPCQEKARCKMRTQAGLQGTQNASGVGDFLAVRGWRGWRGWRGGFIGKFLDCGTLGVDGLNTPPTMAGSKVTSQTGKVRAPK